MHFWSFSSKRSRIGKISRIQRHSRLAGSSWLLALSPELITTPQNYYLERGFNMDDSRNNGEFSTQEIRAYLPLTLGNHSVTPYTRIGLDRWSNWDWQDDIEREGHDFNRVGLFYGYDFQNGLSVSLEYAFEWQDHDEGDSDKFHYAGVGVNYSF